MAQDPYVIYTGSSRCYHPRINYLLHQGFISIISTEVRYTMFEVKHSEASAYDHLPVWAASISGLDSNSNLNGSLVHNLGLVGG